MLTLIEGFCVFLAFSASIYCICLLGQCWLHVSFRRKKTAPDPTDYHNNALTRAHYCCRFAITAIALWLAVTFVVTHSEVFSISRQSDSKFHSISRQTDPLALVARPGVLVYGHTTAAGWDYVGIDCACSQISDEQIASMLQTNPDLRWLNLSRTSAKRALLELNHTRSLDTLILEYTQITDDELIHIKQLKNLKNLSLDGTQITNEGLAHIKGLTNLEKLFLNNTQVTDEGLTHIKKLTNLEELFLENTQITDESAKELTKALPHCVIHL